MPLLGGLLVNLFGGVVAWLATWFTRKVAFGLAAVASMSALTLGIYVLMRGTLAAVAALATGAPAMFVDAIGMVLPPAFPAALASYITMWTAVNVYTWQRDLLHLFAKAG